MQKLKRTFNFMLARSVLYGLDLSEHEISNNQRVIGRSIRSWAWGVYPAKNLMGGFRIYVEFGKLRTSFIISQ